MSDSGATVTPNRQNLMVDLSQAIVFVQEIYAAVDPHVAATIFEALSRFEQNSDAPFVATLMYNSSISIVLRRGEIEKLAKVLKRNLKGHRDLLEKFNFYFPKVLKCSMMREFRMCFCVGRSIPCCVLDLVNDSQCPIYRHRSVSVKWKEIDSDCRSL